MIFSGSAVHDRRNTSGLCEGRSETCLIAVYTGHGHDRQTQNLAVSVDSGRTWRKHAGNPVLDIGAKDFRDPKVFWHEPTRRWVMVVALSDREEGPLLRLARPPALGGAQRLRAPGCRRRCLGVPGPLRAARGRPAGADAMGARRGRRTGAPPPVEPGGSTSWASSTAPASAATSRRTRPRAGWTTGGTSTRRTSFSDLPESDRRRIWMGWLSNWEYAKVEPTPPWRGMQSVPREVRLVAGGRRDRPRPAAHPRDRDAAGRAGRRRAREGSPGAGFSPSRATRSTSRPSFAPAPRRPSASRCAWATARRRSSATTPRPRGSSSTAPGPVAPTSTPPSPGGTRALSPSTGPPPAARPRRPLVGGGRSAATAGRDQRSHLPPADSRGVALFAEGGTAEIVSLRAWPLEAAVRPLTNVSRPVRRGAATWPAPRGRGRASRERPRRAPREGRNAIRAAGAACRPAGPPRRPPRP